MEFTVAGLTLIFHLKVIRLILQGQMCGLQRSRWLAHVQIRELLCWFHILMCIVVYYTKLTGNFFNGAALRADHDDPRTWRCAGRPRRLCVKILILLPVWGEMHNSKTCFGRPTFIGRLASVSITLLLFVNVQYTVVCTSNGRLLFLAIRCGLPNTGFTVVRVPCKFWWLLY